MKKFVKILLIVLVVLVLAAAGMLSYLKFALPRVSEAPDLEIEITPVRLERGKYLAWHVTGCMECHSKRDWSTFSGPIIPGTEAAGGMPFTREMGFPGVYYPSNLTPAGLGDWSDGEIFRAITSGVSRDGRSLFPVMPYHDYRTMDTEDIYSIIAYLRTLEPAGGKTPVSESDFPFNFIINLIPEEPEFSTLPDTTDMVALGKYMANAGGCINCHSLQDDKGRMIPGMLFSGGNEFPMPTGGIVRSSNLTPDNETGIGRWTEGAWVARIKAYADSSVKLPEVNTGDFNSVMSWVNHSHMTETDLRAIYRYIQTIEPISNKVEKFTSNKQTYKF
jgi:hypothetical protein